MSLSHPLLQHYPASTGRYDEMLDAAQVPRAHWQAFLDQLQNEDPQQMRARVDGVQRAVRENGVTFNAWADEAGEQRPWDLNVLPLVLPADEWAQIEAAIVQRATLLNKVLCDLYGPQQILADGLLPAALIHGNAGFLRPAHGVPFAGGVALHVYAVDLARAPNGRWWVVADRSQAPSGAGYALENRHLTARAFPELYRDLKVQPVQGFFAALRDSLAHWGRECAQVAAPGAAPLREGEAPLVALLTPGPAHETYYEQSYLARTLGYPLVEGKDLTVRNGLVWLKTLAGLQRVHVLLRHVDDESCDPLELRAAAHTGVVGLADAARRGTVVVANALGANVLESGALLGYLPRLAKALLGEPLQMPSVATWWCGEPAALEDVLGRLSTLVVKPAFPHLRVAPVFGADLSAGARYNLVRDMRQRPQHYVAQEIVQLSQAPVWLPGSGMSNAAAGLRVYACATPDGYVVMPGGLTRVATGRDARLINMQRGGAAKDTWVLAPEHAAPLAHGHAHHAPVELGRGNTFLPSRMVENLFWYGRYAARCDQQARLLRTALDFLLERTLDDSGGERGGAWDTVQALCQSHGLLENTAQADLHIEQALLQAVVAPERMGLAQNLQQLYGVAGTLRERLSLDNWRTLNELMKEAQQAVRHPTVSDASALLDAATRALMTLSGFALDGMTRDNGWRFLSIGRRLERLQFQCDVLIHALAQPQDAGLDWLLELADSIVTYRSRYMAAPEWRPVLDLLVRDDSNPRALAFLLDGLAGYLEKLTQHYGPCGAEHLKSLQAELRALDPDRDLDPHSAVLRTLLERIAEACKALSDQLGMRFFSHSVGEPHGG